MGLRVPDDHVPPNGISGGQRRTDWAVHRAQVRATNRARQRAQRMLIEAHAEEFDEYYRHFGAQQEPPVVPKPTVTRAEQVEAMEAELAMLQDQLAELQEGDGG